MTDDPVRYACDACSFEWIGPERVPLTGDAVTCPKCGEPPSVIERGELISGRRARGGHVCPHCDEPVLAGERLADTYGARVHFECGLRGVLGGLNHMLGRCSCCGGDQPPDPPELSRRQAARAAATYWAILTPAQREASITRRNDRPKPDPNAWEDPDSFGPSA